MDLVLLLVYAWYCVLMFRIMWQYIPYNTTAAFLGVKQDEVNLIHYRIAFFVHVYTSILLLPAGFVQFSSYIRKHHPSVHRIMGRVYVGLILVLVAPSGLVMAWYANGGIVSQVAFIVLSLAWFYTTMKAYSTARAKQFTAHRAWMFRSFALTLSAITLRAWKYILVYLFHPPPMDVYRIVAWLGWTLNLLIAEWILFNTSRK